MTAKTFSTERVISSGGELLLVAAGSTHTSVSLALCIVCSILRYSVNLT